MVEVQHDKLFPQKIIAWDKEWNLFLVYVKYSWLHIFCERCSQLGHKPKRCCVFMVITRLFIGGTCVCIICWCFCTNHEYFEGKLRLILLSCMLTLLLKWMKHHRFHHTNMLSYLLNISQLQQILLNQQLVMIPQCDVNQHTTFPALTTSSSQYPTVFVSFSLNDHASDIDNPTTPKEITILVTRFPLQPLPWINKCFKCVRQSYPYWYEWTIIFDYYFGT